MSLVFCALGVEHDTLASFLSPSSVMVAFMLLILDIAIEGLLSKGLLAEPEEMLVLTEQARMLSARLSYVITTIDTTYLRRPGAL